MAPLCSIFTTGESIIEFHRGTTDWPRATYSAATDNWCGNKDDSQRVDVDVDMSLASITSSLDQLSPSSE